jgi:hypothetical protein
MRRGDLIHMVGYEPNRGQVIHTVDFTDLLNPVLRGDLALASEIERIYTYGYSYYYRYWSPYSGMPLENRILPFTVRELTEDDSGRRDWISHLRLIDMSDPDNPRIADAKLPMNDFPFINKVTHGSRLCSTHVEQATTDTGESLLYHVRTYLDRIDVSDVDKPEMLPPINVPGYLIDTSDDGKLIYTIDYQWDDYGRRRNSVNVLRIEGDQAVLMEVLPISDQINRAVFRDRTIWVSSHKYPWWGVHSDTVASRQPYTVLDRIQIGETGAMSGFASARIHGYHFDLLDVTEELIYLSSRYPYGLLVLDAADPSDPTIVNSARSVGYISRILVHGDVLYSPMGYFGVRTMAVRP